MKVCTSLPARTKSEKNKTNSYCLLSALIENDKRVMEQIAQSFLKGTNGGKVDTSKAVYLLNRVGSSADSESTQQAQLDAYMRTNNWVETLRSRPQHSFAKSNLPNHSFTTPCPMMRFWPSMGMQ